MKRATPKMHLFLPETEVANEASTGRKNKQQQWETKGTEQVIQ